MHQKRRILPGLTNTEKLFNKIRLKNLVSEPLTNGFTLNKITSTGSVRYLKVFDIDRNNNLKEHHNNAIYCSCSPTSLLEINDVLLVIAGATLGKSYIHKNVSLQVCFSQNFTRVRCNHLVLPEYLYLFTFSKSYSEWIKQMYTQATIPYINTSKISNLEIPCSDLETQQSIVAYCTNLLETITSLRKIQAAKLKLLEKQKQALISEVFSKSNNQMRLKMLLSSPLFSGISIIGGKIPQGNARFIKITDIDKYGNLKEDEQANYYQCSENYLLKQNDILIIVSGSVGRAYLHDLNSNTPMCYSHYFARARLNSKLAIPQYVYMYTFTEEYQKWINTVYTRSTIANISKKKLSNLLIPYTDLETQQSIVDYCSRVVSTINEAKEVITQKLQELEKLKESLISEVVTGQIDVRNVVIPEYSFSQLENFADVDDSEDEESDSTAQDFTEDQDVD